MTPLQATLELARRGRREILPQLRQALDEHPELWQRYGDIAVMCQESWLVRLAEKNLLVLESTRRQAEALKRELAGDRPTPLENLIVERVVAAWLASVCADVAAASEAGTGKVATFLTKRAETAQRQFMNAARSLALVRRLLVRPVVIVNEQVKAGDGTTRRTRQEPGAGRMSEALSDEFELAGVKN